MPTLQKVRLPKETGRPKLDEAERRCKQINVRLTIAEDQLLRRHATDAQLSVGEFVRRRILGLPVTPPPAKADAQLLFELNRIGVNINQIARNLNSGREGVPLDWAAVQDELSVVLSKVGSVFDDLRDS